MALSKTQQALALVKDGMSVREAARQVDITEPTVYIALGRQKEKQLCPCCNQIVRAGFEVDRSAREDAQPWDESIKAAYGGVIFDAEGKLLLREPKNHFDGYVWTFAKGRPAAGETPEQTAQREAREETGVEATIIDRLPGEYRGGTSLNRYFLMQAPAGSGGVKPGDKETASIRWVAVDEAAKLIQQTTNETGRKRDLAVLGQAWAWWLLREFESAR